LAAEVGQGGLSALSTVKSYASSPDDSCAGRIFCLELEQLQPFDRFSSYLSAQTQADGRFVQFSFGTEDQNKSC